MRFAVMVPCALAVGLGACYRPVPAVSRVEPMVVDSLRGIVQRIGNEPQAQLIVRAAVGAVCALRAEADAPLSALEGVEATLWGVRDGGAAPMMPGASCSFDVARYAVRAVDGIAALDGMLRADGASFLLEMASGERRPLRDVPAALRQQLGARIFWAGPLDRAPAAYGVLVAAPR